MQDTPAIKITYDAKVTVNSPYIVKMSANDSIALTTDDDKTSIF